jgi:ubiquinone/menaquinone biosynthesis C-methylase UbiE
MWPFKRSKPGKPSQPDAANSPETRERRGFLFFGDRRFVADAPYMLPKDDAELSRLDFQHYMLRYALRGNFAPPIEDPRAIVDIGSGTGRWALEMAQLFPQARVVAVDLVAPPDASGATAGHRPPNYTFVEGNVLQGLPFEDGAFDFTHQRALLGAIPEAAWPGVARELARVTRSGGWVQLIEPAPAPHGGPGMNALAQWTQQASMRRGINTAVGAQVGEFLRQAGLQEIHAREIEIPMGGQAGRLGVMAETNYFSLFSSTRNFIVAMGVTDAASYDAALAQAHAELDRSHYVSPYYLAYGRKA